MILILGERGDHTTDKISDWLQKFEARYTRLDDLDIISTLKFNLSNDNVSVFLQLKDGSSINLENIQLVFLRRHVFSYQAKETCLPLNSAIDLKGYLQDEWEAISTFIYQFIQLNIPVIGTYQPINKLAVLMMAQKLSISIPTTFIVNTKADIPKGKYITKAIKNSLSEQDGESSYANYTSTLPATSEIGSEFFPSLIQEEIVPLYEVRSFFFVDQFFSMAIFSSRSNSSIRDYRDNENCYNTELPYKLPAEVKNKLKALFSSLKLKTGSVDLMVDSTGTHIFLEINTEGQLDWMSYECNYQIEKYIAKTLIREA